MFTLAGGSEGMIFLGGGMTFRGGRGRLIFFMCFTRRILRAISHGKRKKKVKSKNLLLIFFARVISDMALMKLR